MGGCGSSTDKRFYMFTAAGITKIVAIIVGTAPVIIAYIVRDHYVDHARPESRVHIRVPRNLMEKWELAFLVILSACVCMSFINLLVYSFCKCLSMNVWTKRLDCVFFTFLGASQAVLGLIMVASALSSSKSESEPVELKYAAGFSGIGTGIVYLGVASLVNRD